LLPTILKEDFMRNAYKAFLLTVVLIFAIGAVAQSNSNSLVPSGTQISVRTDQAINVKGSQSNTNNNTSRDDNRNSSNNSNSNSSYNGDQVYSGTVSADVMDSQGRVAIPSGSPVQMAVVNTGNNELTLDLRSITVNGQTYNIYSDDTSAAGSNKRGGLGANKRTGEYVGGGALAGTLLGAIAGGAKGAAIGAIAGGAAGAGAQVVTKGKDLSVPAETKLQFRINRDLDLGNYQAPSRNPMSVPQSH
jgi:hypothetical protein